MFRDIVYCSFKYSIPSDNGIKSFLNFVGGKYYIERSFHKKNIIIVWTKTELNFVPFPVLFLYCTFYKLKGRSSKDVTPLVEISTKKVLKKTDEEDDESHELLTDAYLGLQFQMPTMPFIKFLLISGKEAAEKHIERSKSFRSSTSDSSTSDPSTSDSSTFDPSTSSSGRGVPLHGTFEYINFFYLVYLYRLLDIAIT